jgi:2,3-bisphosphoglycerate-independent phosphoglycerate mutase
MLLVQIFERERYPKNLKFVGMMQYDGDLQLPANYLVPPPEIENVGDWGWLRE